MNKQEFNNLDVLEQLEYVNSELITGKSLRGISEILTISKTTIRDRLIKIGYVYNKELRQYTNDKTIEVKDITSNTKALQKGIKRDIEVIEKSNTRELQKYDNDLLELINNKDDILVMLEHYKRNMNIIEIPQLDINNIPQEMQKDIIIKSIRVYEPIYKLFDEVSNQYASIKKQDLLSMALLEFYNKYKK